MPTTTKGLPYPASTAPPNVPADLQALAQDLDFTKVMLLSGASGLTAGSLLSAYPLGVSVLSLSSAEGASGGWPGGTSCHVWTFKPTTTRAWQFVWINSTFSRGFARSLQPDPGPHAPWVGGSAPYAQAVGTVTLDAATNPTATVQVNFPAGRFSVTPRVVVSSSTPSVFVAVSGVSTTAATFIGRNVNTYTSTLTGHWHAIQATSASQDG